MKPRLHKRSRAFTLLEIMVSLALLSVLVAGIYSCWYSIIKGVDVAAHAAARAQQSRLIKRTLEDSLLCACMFDANATYYQFIVDSDGTYSSLSFVACLPDSFPRSGKFGGLNTRRLTFSVENGADSSRQLILRQSPLLMEPDQNEMDFPLVLAKNVNEFLVKFRDPKDAKSWVTEWRNTNQLPREVLIQVTLRDQSQTSTGGEDVLAPIDVAIPAQNVRAEWQTPGGAIPALQQTNGAGTNTTPPVNPPSGKQLQMGGGQ
jgi:prepilin-type N-terminal cleavage/methylation domain-containing protein